MTDMWVHNPPAEQLPSDATLPASDLGTQLEDLLVHVFDCEKWARLSDRIDLATALQPVRRTRRHARG